MKTFKFEHAFRFTEKRYVELYGVLGKKNKPLRIAAIGAAGVACLFWSYTFVTGIVILAFLILMLFMPGLMPGAMAHTYRRAAHLHDTLTYGVSDQDLWVTGPQIEARVPWKAAYLWDLRDGWLRISGGGVPNFWFPVAKLKDADIYERVIELCKLYAVRFNSREAREYGYTRIRGGK